MVRIAYLLAACWLSLTTWASAQQYSQPLNMAGQSRPAQALLPEVAPQVAPLPGHAPKLTPEARHGSLSELTPSMWFYEQERQEYQNPKNAVRAAAEFRADQRRKRLAASQWFGYSNARPIRAVTPTTTPSPQWGSNSADPFIWSGTGRTTVVHVPDAAPYWR